ncbi:HAMP domain-containing protein [bacterium]|nr:HAMP domain-containing protein [bacterium]
MTLSLSRKIALVAFATLFITLGTMIFLMLQAEQKREMSTAMEQAESNSHMVVQALVFAMREGVTDVTPFEEEASSIGLIRELRVIPMDIIDPTAAATLDEFERETLAHGEEKSRIEEFKDKSVLRISTPIISDQSCVDCHGGAVGDAITVVTLRTSLEEAQASIAGQRFRAILMGFGTLIVTIIILYLLVNARIVGAIRKCVSFAGRLAQGDLREELVIHSKDETGQLADSFNQLRDSLHAKEVASQRIAAGDLSEDAPIASDQDSLGRAMQGIMNSLRTMQSDLARTTNKLAEGQLDARCECDESKLAGSYADLIKGVNQALEAVVQPLMTALNCIGQYADGDLSSEMPELPGQQQIITDGLNRIRGNLQDLVDEARTLSNAAEEGNLSVRADTGKLSGAFRDVIEGMNHTIDNLLAPIQEAARVLKRMETGDFTATVQGDYHGDHAVIKDAINNVLGRLNHLLTNISEAVDQVKNGSEQVSTSSQSLSDGATRQASSLEEISSSMQEVQQRAETNGSNANEARKLSDGVRSSAEEGNERMAKMLDAMEGINNAAGEISQIIKTIDEIAFQTNLLALNAAVEAARAGAHGKGFAVVAEEVRNLAQRSAKAASETTQLIEQSIERSRNGSRIATDTADSLGTIITGVGKVSGVIGEIAEAVSHQSVSIKGINDGLTDIDQVTQGNSAIAEETAASSEELAGQTATLSSMLQEFTLTRSGGSRVLTGTTRGGMKQLGGVASEDDLAFDDFDSF